MKIISVMSLVCGGSGCAALAQGFIMERNSLVLHYFGSMCAARCPMMTLSGAEGLYWDFL